MSSRIFDLAVADDRLGGRDVDHGGQPASPARSAKLPGAERAWAKLQCAQHEHHCQPHRPIAPEDGATVSSAGKNLYGSTGLPDFSDVSHSIHLAFAEYSRLFAGAIPSRQRAPSRSRQAICVGSPEDTKRPSSVPIGPAP